MKMSMVAFHSRVVPPPLSFFFLVADSGVRDESADQDRLTASDKPLMTEGTLLLGSKAVRW